jgi:hypothetical protein
MFIGHYAVGFALKRPAPRTSLGLLLASALFLDLIWIYQRTTRAVDRTGRLGLWILVALLAVIYVGNAFGQPPPSVRALAFVALAAWIFPFWAAWIDRHREVVVDSR